MQRQLHLQHRVREARYLRARRRQRRVPPPAVREDANRSQETGISSRDPGSAACGERVVSVRGNGDAGLRRQLAVTGQGVIDFDRV